MLEPEYVEGLSARSIDDVRSMLHECLEVETELSYVRRLAQARIDILDAEFDRRAAGGTIGDLIRSLPSILADSGPTTPPAQARMNKMLAPSPSIEWQRGLEHLIGDETLVNLPTLTEDELQATLGQLRELERDTSDRRQALEAVIEHLEADVGSRYQVESS